MKDILRKLKIFASWNLDRAFVVEREFQKNFRILKIVHHFEILKAKLQLIDKNKKDILGKLKIFASWNLDQEFGSIRIFLKIVYHFEILKAKFN